MEETDTYRRVDRGLREQILQRSECRCEECGKLMVDRLGGFIWFMTDQQQVLVNVVMHVSSEDFSHFDGSDTPGCDTVTVSLYTGL